MPYPNEHAARMREPGDFEQESFRRMKDKFGPGVDAIFGKPKGGEGMELQTIRFTADKFTAEEARAWLREHKYKPIKFEKATEEKSMEDKTRQWWQSVAVVKSINLEEKTAEVVMSTPTRDRQGDIVDPQGLDFTNYMKNPVVLWAHNYNELPIGRVESVSATPQGVNAKVKFANTPKAQECFEMYRDGFLKGWSVGFIPKMVAPHTDGTMGRRVLKAEVVELSATPIPANQEALTKAMENTMDCPRCGAKCGVGSKFCAKCGTEIVEQKEVVADTGDGETQEGDGENEIIAPVGQEADGFCPNCGKKKAECKCAATDKDKEKKKSFILHEDGMISGGKKAYVLPDGRTLRQTAMTKSITEALAAGKIITSRKVVASPEEVGFSVEFVVVKEYKGEVTEAKVIGATFNTLEITEEDAAAIGTALNLKDDCSRVAALKALDLDLLNLSVKVLTLNQ